jgi:hypothetical protein
MFAPIGNFLNELGTTVEGPNAAAIAALTAQTVVPNPRFDDTEGASKFIPNPFAEREIERLKALGNPKVPLEDSSPMAMLGAAIGNASTMIPSFVTGLMEGTTTLTEGFGEQIAAQQEIQRRYAAQVGSFSDTRNNLINIVSNAEKLDEDRNKLLETIATNTEGGDDPTFGG